MSGDDYTKPCKVYEIPPFFDVRVPREVAWVADQGYLITRDRLVVEHDDAGDVVSVGKAGEPGWNTINNTEAHRHSVLLRAAKQKSEDLWAVRTGVVSGVVMLDFDGPEGVATLFKLGLQPTLTTPGGGAHVWVSAPGRRVRSAGYDGAGRFSGMEVKAEGAKATFFGVNPHEDGRTYTFTSWPPKVIDWEELPGDLRGYVETLPEASAGEGEADWGSASEPTEQWIRRKLTTAVEKIKNCEGRNDVGFWFLMRLWNQGLTKEQARPWAEEFQELAEPLGSGAYTVSEVTDTLESVWGRPPEGRSPETGAPKGPVRTGVVDDLPGDPPLPADYVAPAGYRVGATVERRTKDDGWAQVAPAPVLIVGRAVDGNGEETLRRAGRRLARTRDLGVGRSPLPGGRSSDLSMAGIDLTQDG